MQKNQSVPSNTYHYQGYNTQGQYISGELQSSSLQLAKIQLRRQGIRLKKIQNSSPSFQLKWPQTDYIQTTEINLFTRQLATLIKANIDLLRALDLIRAGTQRPAMQRLLYKLKAQVESGQRFSYALTQHRRYFDSLFVALIQTGEQSGTLDIMLDRIANHQERTATLKQRIKKALWYPCMVMSVALSVSLILILKVVPIFHELFNSLAAELPAFTQWVLSLSRWLQDYFLLILCSSLILPSLIIYSYHHHPKPRRHLDHYSFKLPIWGALLHKSIISRFHQTLATTFAAGVPLLEALQYTAMVSNNTIYQEAVIKIHDDVASGQQLHFAMQNVQFFPQLAIQMVAIGEESGSLTEMLDHIAAHFDAEVTHSVEGLSTLLEPSLLIFLSLIVGGLVVAMYLPIIKMGSMI